jgi:signal transduction histidine kinase
MVVSRHPPEKIARPFAIIMNIHVKLRHKFILVFSPLLLIIFVFGIFGIRAFISANQIFLNLQQSIAPSAFAVMEFKEVLISLEAAINARVINRNEIEGQISRLKTLIKKHLPLDDQRGDTAKKAEQDLRMRAIRVMSLARYILNLTENNWQEDKIAQLFASIHQEQMELGTILEQELANHLRDLSQSEKQIAENSRIGVFIIWSAIAMGLGITLFMVVYMARTILTPIKVLQEGAKQIGNGLLDYHFELQSGDEFEELADEFKSMASKLADSYSQLDGKVLARTRELSQANSDLTKEISERIQAEEEQKKAEAQVHTLTQELIKVQEIERKRIALDLHDNVAQELSAMKVLSETLCLEQTMDQTELRRQMHEWSEVLTRCVGTIRELSYNLMPPGLEHLGIKSALSSYCRDFSKKNAIPIEFTSAGMDGLSLALDYDIAINLYRLVQEALNNIKKHAGACHAKVRLLSAGSKILLQIEDDGQGCDLIAVGARALATKRLGLLGIRERIKSLSGAVTIVSRPREGMKIFIEIPWEKADASEKKGTHY